MAKRDTKLEKMQFRPNPFREHLTRRADEYIRDNNYAWHAVIETKKRRCREGTNNNKLVSSHL